MVCAIKYVQFFRFRPPPAIKPGEGAKGINWLIESIQYINFGIELLIQESILIGVVTKGTFTYDIVRNLPFDEYEIILREVKKVVAEMKNSNNNEDDNG